MRCETWVRVLATFVLCVSIASVTRALEPRDAARLARATARCKSAELISCADALNLLPNNADLLVAEGDALVQLQRPGEALGVYRNGLTVGATRAAVYAKIAIAETLRRTLLDTCLDQASHVAEHACEGAWLPGAADEVTVFRRRGLLLQQDHDFSAALDAYLSAARLRPKDRDIARSIVFLCKSTQRTDASTLAALGTAQLVLGHRASLVLASHAQNNLGAATRRTPKASIVDTSAGAAEHFTNQAEITRSN